MKNNSKQQDKKDYTNSGGSASKSKLSMVMKLNLHMFSSTLGILLSVNIILCVMAFSFTLWQAENNAVPLIDERISSNKTILEYYFDDTELNNKGIELPKVLHKQTPLKDYEVLRSMSFESKFADTGLDRFFTLKYYMLFPKEDVILTYNLGNVLGSYLFAFNILLALEAVILLLRIITDRRAIRRILRPLSDMAKQAQNLTTTQVGAISRDDMQNLEKLAGTISSIDATKLDKRLPVDDTQSELKDLAFAINSMLNRIDEAYQSQVRFVSDASHELRTPISVIQGYANLLDRWGKNDEATLQESIDAIKSEAESMKDLIEQLLFLARGDNETLQLHPESFDSSDIVEEILRETQLIDSLHTFHAKSNAPAYINADRQLMKQAIRILVENSIKYTPKNGEILVSVSSQEGFVRISVQDNGIGIDSQNLPYIFDRFYRSEESRARKTGGSGLGLSIMKWIIDRHGGTIEVISRKGIGTRTTILLPQVDSPALPKILESSL